MLTVLGRYLKFLWRKYVLNQWVAYCPKCFALIGQDRPYETNVIVPHGEQMFKSYRYICSSCAVKKVALTAEVAERITS